MAEMCKYKGIGSGKYDFCRSINGECQFLENGFEDGHICPIKWHIDSLLYKIYGAPNPPDGLGPIDEHILLCLEQLGINFCTEDEQFAIAIEKNS